MARCRSVIVLVLLALWLAIPALACLPNQQMTAAEMACCKKMAGNCQMGVGQHPCCRTIATRQPMASTQLISLFQPSLAVTAQIILAPLPSLAQSEAMQTGLGLPPPSPPGLRSILRI